MGKMSQSLLPNTRMCALSRDFSMETLREILNAACEKLNFPKNGQIFALCIFPWKHLLNQSCGVSPSVTQYVLPGNSLEAAWSVSRKVKKS